MKKIGKRIALPEKKAGRGEAAPTEKKRAGRSGSLVAELICCLLGTAAFCSALLPALGQEVSMMECMLFALVDISIIFLLSRRWWITPALIVLIALAGAVAIRFFHVWEPAVEYVEGFIEWYDAAYPYTLPYSENGSQFLVHLAFSFPVTLVLYIYFRRLPFLPVWVLLSGALLVWMYLTKAEGFMAVAALLLMAGIVLIARTNAGSINRKLGSGEKIPTAAMQLTALALAPLVVLFSFALGPKEDGAWQSSAIALVEKVKENIAKVIVGKEEQTEELLLALVCGGHVLIEDVPGLGKTTLVTALARSLNCTYSRIQFTSDLLPSDVTGYTAFNPKTGEREVCFGGLMAQ